MTVKKSMTYSEAILRIESILEQIEEGEMEIDDLSAHLKEVSKLIKLCKGKIGQTEKEIDNILKSSDNQKQ